MTILHFLSWTKQSTPHDFTPYIEEIPYCMTKRDDEGRLLLHLAAQRGNTELLKFFFKQPPAWNVQACDNNGVSILHYAAESRRVETLDIVLGQGADLRATDRKGRTVLHHAVLRDNVDAVRRVIELGGVCNLWAVDKTGQTPLELSVLRKAVRSIAYLKEMHLQSSEAVHSATCSWCSQRPLGSMQATGRTSWNIRLLQSQVHAYLA